MRTLDTGCGVIRSLLIVDYQGKQVLASGDEPGKIKLWSLDRYQNIVALDRI